MDKHRPQTSILSSIDFGAISNSDLGFLLGRSEEIRHLLQVLQSNNLLEDVLLLNILSEARKKDGYTDDPDSCSSWRAHRWGDRVEEIFIDRKRNLDKVSFWMANFKDKGSAMESFYQLCNKEATFDDLALMNKEIKLHKEVCYDQLTPSLQKHLRGAGTSKPLSPFRTKSGFLLAQVVEQRPAQLTEELSNHLLMQLEKDWAYRELRLRIEDFKFNQSTSSTNIENS